MAEAARATGISQDSVLPVIYTELDRINERGIALTENTDITTDLAVDSVAIMDLMFVLEETFDVAVPLNDLADVRTIGQLAGHVERLARG